MIALDLFSGAGGMSLGAKCAGVKVLNAVENDPWACSTFRHNFPQVDVFEGDISTFTPPELPAKGSLIFGGPPCQGFSTSNPGQTHLNFESFKEEVVIQGYFEAFTLQARLPGDTSQ